MRPIHLFIKLRGLYMITYYMNTEDINNLGNYRSSSVERNLKMA